MAWFIENWFWALIFIAFIAMHMFGHGGHGGHGGNERELNPVKSGNDTARSRGANTRSGGHQH